MTALIIEGGKPLSGQVKISGAKNATLPILAASLLATAPVTLRNVPRLMDVSTMVELIGGMGVSLNQSEHELQLFCQSIVRHEAPYDLVRSMRASVLVLGPLLARFGKAVVSLPGGCAIGSRPVDLHIEGMKALGATVKVENGNIYAERSERLKGADFTFETVTVTGTENVMMAAVLAEGITHLRHCAQEPEIIDLANFLNALGAKIKGAGTDTITIEGVTELGGTLYSIMPDRIEAGTFLAAAAATGGKITLEGIQPDTMDAVLIALSQAGAEIERGEETIHLDMQGKRAKAIPIETAPYPGFPTDMQAQWMALNAVASGEAAVIETIFENRFMHVQELQRMGADIRLAGNTAYVKGMDSLQGTIVNATDLRASACLIVAGLAAKGETTIEQIHHLDRGYEQIEQKLSALGANIRRRGREEKKL